MLSPFSLLVAVASISTFELQNVTLPFQETGITIAQLQNLTSLTLSHVTCMTSQLHLRELQSLHTLTLEDLPALEELTVTSCDSLRQLSLIRLWNCGRMSFPGITSVQSLKLFMLCSNIGLDLFRGMGASVTELKLWRLPGFNDYQEIERVFVNIDPLNIGRIN